MGTVRFMLALFFAAVGLIPLALIAVVSYQTWRKEGSLKEYRRAIALGVLSRLPVLLIAVVVLLMTLERAVPFALLIFIGLLALVSTVIGVSDAIQTARSGIGKRGPHHK